jgi:hypothetical protein
VGAIGVGLGVVVRNQVASIIGLLAWGFAVSRTSLASSSVGASGLSTGRPDRALEFPDHLPPAAAGRRGAPGVGRSLSSRRRVALVALT